MGQELHRSKCLLGQKTRPDIMTGSCSASACCWLIQAKSGACPGSSQGIAFSHTTPEFPAHDPFAIVASSASVDNPGLITQSCVILSAIMDTIILGIKLVAAWTVAYFIGYIVGFVKYSGRPQLPPGPKGFPILGNISDLPPAGELEARHWLKHKSQYGAWLPLNHLLPFARAQP